MTQRMRSRVIEIFVLFSLALAAAAVMPRANAGMIGTDEATAPPQSDRERVKALLARPVVAKGLEKFGVKAEDAAARVDAMTDDEVAQLAGRIDALTAGGALTNDQLIVILLLVVILVLLL
ncbi:MAG: PA2779 family protein [Burkholderiales bacterium]